MYFSHENVIETPKCEVQCPYTSNMMRAILNMKFRSNLWKMNTTTMRRLINIYL
jgi:hypothetical protein